MKNNLSDISAFTDLELEMIQCLLTGAIQNLYSLRVDITHPEAFDKYSDLYNKVKRLREEIHNTRRPG